MRYKFLYLNLILPLCVSYSFERSNVVIFEAALESKNGYCSLTVEALHIGEMLLAEEIVEDRMEYYSRLSKSDTRILIYSYREQKSFSGINERVKTFSWRIENENVVFVSKEGKQLIPLKEFIQALKVESGISESIEVV